MKTKKLNFFHVAIMYVGTIMGAGFASGREAWQFFGIFGDHAFIGISVAGTLFILIGMMVSYIARALNTDDMGRCILFFQHEKASHFIGWFMAGLLYTIIIPMSAAGGAFLNQQFGLHPAVGGAIIVVLVIFTVLGDFERISKVFRFTIPLLFVVDIVCCMLIINADIEQSGPTSGFTPSAMASTWPLAAILFVSYNMLGMIPIVAAASINAEGKRHAILGSGLGGLMLSVLTVILIFALRKDMALTNSTDLPMLAFTAKISVFANIMFGSVMFCAIYSAATSTYYGFSTKLKDTPRKKYIIIGGAIVGFFCGLSGFKTIVAFLYPIEGYIGLIIIIMITINFFRVLKMKKSDERSTVTRVTAGYGGEAFLIFGSEKTVLYDCGMAYCHHGLIENIQDALNKSGRSTIDMVLLSHTHYDHVGALPYILQQWPEVVVIGAAKAKSVFESRGALETILRLGQNAAKTYGSDEGIITSGMRIDQVVTDGDRLSIGEEYIQVIETPGHTDCSLTYVLEPEKIMFLSESTGVLRSKETMHTAILKGYEDAMASCEKCRSYGANQLIGPHYGIVPKDAVETYFNMFSHAAEEERDFILNLADQGYSRDEIMDAFESRFWTEERGKSQPKAAFYENAKYSINHILEVFRP